MKLNFKKIGEGKPLIILHGIYGSLDNWMTLGKKFARDFEVYLVDQRNHGKSPHSNEFNYSVLSEDIKEFINEHNLENVILTGHSMGGKVAMEFALKYPDQLEKLIVVDIAPRNYSVGHDHILEGLCALDVDQIESREDADEKLSEYINEKSIRLFLLKNLTRKQNGGFEWKLNLPVIKDNIVNIGKGLQSEGVLRKPVLFIKGGKSDYIRSEDREKIKNYFPNYKMEIIDNAGHWVHAEAPDEFYDILMNFIS